MSLTVRPATASDATAWVEMRALMFTDAGMENSEADWQTNARDWFHDAVNDPSMRLVVIDDGNHDLLSCGMAQVHQGAPGPTCPSGRTAHVSNIVTRRSARGRGLATLCMTHLLQWAANHADRAELHASAHGISLYRELGFSETLYPSMRLKLTPLL
jgi:GNAT superfamily N-acetyltransferase